jgi:GR25 family glycosyltransferase involved in LPS biosynthesis
MNLLLYNISSTSIDKILNAFLKNKNIKNFSNITLFTNIDFIKNTSLFSIIYVENVLDSNLQNFILTNNILFVITNVINIKLVKQVSSTCKFISLVKNSNPEIYLLKDVSALLDSYFNLLDSNKLLNNTNTTNNANNTNNTNNDIDINIIHSSSNYNTLDSKEKYREICVTYLESFKKIPVLKLELNLTKEAVLVEFRELKHLEVLIRNTIFNLGNTWSFTIVCGSGNYNFINNICNNIAEPIKIIKMKYDNLNQNQYNNLLCTSKFWDLFVGEKILIYQEDTCIFKKNIDDFLKYDYIGAPFGISSVSPINIGNGGFSLRTKSIMKKIIELCPPENFVSASQFVNKYKNKNNLDLYPEDNYFPQTMQNMSIGIISLYEDAKQFSSEQVFTPDCLGMHCFWFSNNKWEKYIHDYFQNIGAINRFINNINNNINIVKTNHNFDCYIIHCTDFHDRDTIVKKTIEQLNIEGNINVEIINSLNTSNINLNIENQEKILTNCDPNLKFANKNKFMFYKAGQIGCYIGHHLSIKTILNKNSSSKYSIIFEDDISLTNKFTEQVSDIVNYFETTNISFDVIYLGSLNNNGGKKLHNNIYKPIKYNWLFGAHGLLINNKSVDKLYKYNCNILHEIDNHYKLLYNDDKLNIFYINSSLVNQNREIFSYINLKKNNY